MAERETRHRRCCCFTGHRPEKLDTPEDLVIGLLGEAIAQAAGEGFRTFITGCAKGVDLWAAELVLERRKYDPGIRLVCAVPFEGFGLRWAGGWAERFRMAVRDADMVEYVCPGYSRSAYQRRNEWMVDRSELLIAAYGGQPGGTRNTIEYALRKGTCRIRYLDMGS